MAILKFISFLNLLFITSLNVTCAQKSFFIKGKIDVINSKKICLTYINSFNKVIEDTQIIVNGKFQFRGWINEPTPASLTGYVESATVNEQNFTPFFIEPNRIKIKLKDKNFKNLISHGSISQNKFSNLNILEAPIINKQDEIYQKIKNEESSLLKDSITSKKINSLKDELANYKNKIKDIEIKFIQANNNSIISAYLLQYYVTRVDIDSVKLLFDRLDASVKRSKTGAYIERQIRNTEASTVGQETPNFVAVDYKGNTIKSIEFRNKYLLLDFWGSWCRPCRKGNPHLIDIYKTYNPQGLELVSIAKDDDDQESWRHAINEDGIGIWCNILQGFSFEKFNKGEENESDIGEKFNITVYPTKILINKEGIIIGRYQGDDNDNLDDKLKEIFNK